MNLPHSTVLGLLCTFAGAISHLDAADSKGARTLVHGICHFVGTVLALHCLEKPLGEFRTRSHVMARAVTELAALALPFPLRHGSYATRHF